MKRILETYREHYGTMLLILINFPDFLNSQELSGSNRR